MMRDVAQALLAHAELEDRNVELRIRGAMAFALLDVASAIREFTEAYQRRTSMNSLDRRRPKV